MIKSWPTYNGAIDRKKMTNEARFGYESLCGQRNKCNNPKNLWFKYYGGKGIRVEYSSRDFLGWWLYNLKFFTGTKATCGRIDHNKSYSFDNIIMQDVTDNSREAILRNRLNHRERQLKGQKIICLRGQNKTPHATFFSIRDAAKHFNVSQRLVQFLVRGKYKFSRKIDATFCYLGGEK